MQRADAMFAILLYCSQVNCLFIYERFSIYMTERSISGASGRFER